MTLRERILAVYRGETPDVVPYMLDLSHWFYHRRRLPWDLSQAYVEPERELIDYHKRAGVGFYLPNLAAFYSAAFPPDVKATTERRTNDNGVAELVWRIETPLGSIERTRTWEERSYAWGISRWGIRTEADLRVFGYAMSRRSFAPHWDRYTAWDRYVGDCGVIYMPLGYSAMGHLLNYWMGVEAATYATADWAGLMHETADSVNRNTLELVDLLCQSSAQVVIMGDNFSSDIQPPSFFNEWSRDFYIEAIARLHNAGKFVAVHIDGRLRGALRMIRDTGADCADAVTPAPTGDLNAAECRREAGERFILSGGVLPNLWMPAAPLAEFEAKALEWLDQRKTTSRFIANAGDQVPPGADERRIAIMREMVETHGRF
ncbi:MAG: hypothetical protein NTY01_04110 [Verrucomicrobia bacterium]|nr:hypothetical protein [Verrucomicrobiota bacterium]